MQMHSDEFWMQHALALADKAQNQGEIPVGAVLIKDDQIVGEGWNQPISRHDPSAHAEMLAIRNAAQHLQNYRLVDTRLYVTLEPCPMCAGLLVHSRISTVIYGASDYKTGAAGSIMDLLSDQRLNHQVKVVSGVLAEACSEKLSAFFRQRRAEIKAKKKLSRQEA